MASTFPATVGGGANGFQDSNLTALLVQHGRDGVDDENGAHHQGKKP
jgi:hypothetical protein